MARPRCSRRPQCRRACRIDLFRRLGWKSRNPLPIAKHDKAAKAAGEIHLGFPCDLVAVRGIGLHAQIDGGRRRSRTAYGSPMGAP
jgi:hypothetical protein